MSSDRALRSLWDIVSNLSGSMYPRQLYFIVFVSSLFLRSFLLTVQEVAVQDFRISTSIFTFLVWGIGNARLAAAVPGACAAARRPGREQWPLLAGNNPFPTLLICRAERLHFFLASPIVA